MNTNRKQYPICVKIVTCFKDVKESWIALQGNTVGPIISIKAGWLKQCSKSIFSVSDMILTHSVWCPHWAVSLCSVVQMKLCLFFFFRWNDNAMLLLLFVCVQCVYIEFKVFSVCVWLCVCLCVMLTFCSVHNNNHVNDDASFIFFPLKHLPPVRLIYLCFM